MQEIFPNQQPSAASGTMFCNEKEFWTNFLKDLKASVSSICIVSPFIRCDTIWRVKKHFEQLQKRLVKIIIYSRTADEHTCPASFEVAVKELNGLNIEIRMIEKIHHKIAVIDNEIWWEGSLNILSFTNSKEHMRRFVGPEAKNMIQDIGLDPNPL